MKIADFLAKSIQNRTDGIGNASCQNPEEKGERKDFQHRANDHDQAPAHRQIKEHGKIAEPMHIDGAANNPADAPAPFHDQQKDSDAGIVIKDLTNQNGRICSGNEKINGTVINDPQHLFGYAFF